MVKIYCWVHHKFSKYSYYTYFIWSRSRTACMCYKDQPHCSAIALDYMLSCSEQHEIICRQKEGKAIFDIAEVMNRSQTVIRSFLAHVKAYGIKKHLGRPEDDNSSYRTLTRSAAKKSDSCLASDEENSTARLSSNSLSNATTYRQALLLESEKFSFLRLIESAEWNELLHIYAELRNGSRLYLQTITFIRRLS